VKGVPFEVVGVYSPIPPNREKVAKKQIANCSYQPGQRLLMQDLKDATPQRTEAIPNPMGGFGKQRTVVL